ncbi:MAG: hypothetical protein KH026_05315 [Clostridium sp.]|nr:hypothetical protein [Clostridium sp.]
MWIDSLKVTGEYYLEYTFGATNILLGENGTGKSTFVKLLLYILGVDIPDFIDEISKYRFCDWVCAEITTKTNNKFRIMRKLPYADMIMVTPYENGMSNDDDIFILNLEDYSNFLLDEEQYSKEKIGYGNGQQASFRYRFILRTAVVDQTTPHGKILASLGGSGNDYISNQGLINKAIIEEILKRNNSEEKRIRLELKSKEKERTSLRAKESLYKELLNEYSNADEKYPKRINAVDKEMNQILQEKDNLSTQQYRTLVKLEHISDKNTEKEIVALRAELNRLKEKQTKAKLEMLDIEDVLKKLHAELKDLKSNIAATTILKDIPVTICPVCLSELNEMELESGLCHNCKEHSKEDVLEKVAIYKKMVEDSIKEAKSLIEQNDVLLKDVNDEIREKTKKLNMLQEKYLNKLEEIKEPLECLIQEIKDKLDVVTGRYYRLSELRKNLVEKNRLTSEKDRLTQEIKILREELEEASKKSSNDILIFEKWKTLYEDIFKEIFSQTCSVSISSEDYMPIINDNTMNRISSESMKLVARLSYVLSLYKLQSYLEIDIVNSVGLVMFDSPKDKDLDNDKYRKFLKIVANNSEGQVFLTGSVMEREIYEEAFDKDCFFNFLTEDDRLLKNTPRTDE